MNQEILSEDTGLRLDQWLANQPLDLSRSRVQKLIGEGQVLVNGARVRPSYKVSSGDQVVVTLPDPEPVDIHPEDVPLDVFFEDKHLLVVNKPAHMTVHPAGPLRSGTLVNALLGHCKQLSGVHGRLRPGIVHRLDKDTSGLLMVAKDDATHQGLSSQLEARTVLRYYAALVWGVFEDDEGRIEASIGRHQSDRTKMAVVQEGRLAATNWQVKHRYDFLTHLQLRLETGRTHQIRVHLAHIHHPVLGDATYGGCETRIKGITPVLRSFAGRVLKYTTRQMLHAQVLGFVHPITGEDLRFEAPLPPDMQIVFDLLD